MNKIAMNKLITITLLLFCCTFPMYSFGMNFGKNKPRTQIKVRPTTYTELIAALKKKTKISTADFINCLQDAQSKNFRIYFISENVSSSLEFGKFFEYYEDNLDNPDAFKNKSGTVFFDARTIPGGFICSNLNEEKPENNQAYVLVTESEYEDGTEKALSLFNIPSDIPESIMRVIKKDELTEVLNALYTSIAHEQEKQIPSEPEVTIPTEPSTEPIAPSEEQQEKQAAAIKQYEPILTHATTIAKMGLIPKELETKAELLMQRITNGLIEPDDKEAKKFFVGLENRVKKETKEKNEEEAKELKIQEPVEKEPLIQFDVYTIPLTETKQEK